MAWLFGRKNTEQRQQQLVELRERIDQLRDQIDQLERPIASSQVTAEPGDETAFEPEEPSKDELAVVRMRTLFNQTELARVRPLLVELEHDEKQLADRLGEPPAQPKRAMAQVEAERIEAERIAAERIAAERIAAEQAEAERIAAERIAAERIEAERIEAERIAAERADNERELATEPLPDGDGARVAAKAHEWQAILDLLDRHLDAQGHEAGASTETPAVRSASQAPALPLGGWIPAVQVPAQSGATRDASGNRLAARVAQMTPAGSEKVVVAAASSPRRGPIDLVNKLQAKLTHRSAQPPRAMEARIGGQADLLRGLGYFLDEQDATTFTIVTDRDVLKVSWLSADAETEHRAYQEHQLEVLRTNAQVHRNPIISPAGSNAELLRTIGQDLDRDQVRLFGIARDAEGFRVSGLAGKTYMTTQYRTSDLVARSIDRQESRGEGAPLLRVKIRAVVRTADRRDIGSVAQVRDGFFQIGASGLRRAYWLPADCISSVGADQQVLLRITRKELRQHARRDLDNPSQP